MKRLWALVLLIGIFLPLFIAGKAKADVNDFTITNFTAEHQLTRDDPQGKLTIKEDITVEFSDNNHGILRAIPKKYKTQNLHTHINSVKNPASGQDWPFTTYSENDNLVVKIGDADRTVTGEQRYVISYTVENVISFYDSHDELYWDINGDDWQQPFLNVSAFVKVPSGLNIQQTKCFTGSFGGTSQSCAINTNSNTNEISANTNESLGARQTLTIVASFNKGYFTPPTWRDRLDDYKWWIIGSLLPPIVIGGWAVRRWNKYGRDIKGRGVIVPEYDAPAKLSPAEVGAITDYGVDNRDISATVIDLAIRGHLKIIESTKKKLFKDKTEYSLELKNSDFSKLKQHERQIIEGIFQTGSAGEVVELKTLKNEFYKTAQKVQKDLSEQLTKTGYFSRNPMKAGGGMLALAIVLFVLAGVLHNTFSIGLALSGLILAGLSVLMKKRGLAGVAAKEHIEGLKLYLQTAEADRIKMLQSPKAPYAPKSSEPKKTVHLFEKLLPFAVVLGVEKEWSNQFKDIYTTPPEWYGGSWHAFNSANFASSVSSSVSAMGTSFAAPSSSGGSGFGGGGGAGGGGGGGGGGGW